MTRQTLVQAILFIGPVPTIILSITDPTLENTFQVVAAMIDQLTAVLVTCSEVKQGESKDKYHKTPHLFLVGAPQNDNNVFPLSEKMNYKTIITNTDS
jgi:hypothetical protein